MWFKPASISQTDNEMKSCKSHHRGLNCSILGQWICTFCTAKSVPLLLVNMRLLLRTSRDQSLLCLMAKFHHRPFELYFSQSLTIQQRLDMNTATHPSPSSLLGCIRVQVISHTRTHTTHPHTSLPNISSKLCNALCCSNYCIILHRGFERECKSHRDHSRQVAKTFPHCSIQQGKNTRKSQPDFSLKDGWQRNFSSFHIDTALQHLRFYFKGFFFSHSQSTPCCPNPGAPSRGWRQLQRLE